MDASTLTVFVSSRTSRAPWLVIALTLSSVSVGCAGVGYTISGPERLAAPPPIVDASLPGARFARGSQPPGLEVELLCLKGPMVRSGFARPQLEAHESGEDGVWILAGDPLSESRAGFSVPVLAPSADAIPFEAGHLFELRAVGRAPVFGGRLPDRLQICKWRPDDALLGRLRRKRDAKSDEPYELIPSIPQSGLRATGKFTVHEIEPATRWWRLRFVTNKGQVIRIRYAPIMQTLAAPIPKDKDLSLHILPPDPAASFSGLAVVIQTLDGKLIAAINSGGLMPSELLGGIEISPSGRLIYTEVRQLPSLCTTRLEHQSMRVRSSQGATYVSPGTHQSIVHGGQRYILFAYDTVVRALEDPCGQQARQHLSYVILRSD